MCFENQRAKTSAVWIGSFKNNVRHLCRNLTLDWKLNGQFEMLGVSFSTNLKDMLDLNYQNAYGAIHSSMGQTKLETL